MANKFLNENFTIENLKRMSIDELKEFSKEIRTFLVEKISKTGGHLASNLGVVELTIALHYVYKSPFDQFIFDVGHQAYVHKIITGRFNKFDSLRKKNGLSGFPKRCESEHDIINSGHSSTSLSAALGLCRARDLDKKNNHVVAIIGDGALTGGMALEALNDIGASKTNITIILNDNGMSISKNVGGLSSYLTRIRVKKSYNRVKKSFEVFSLQIPFIGKQIVALTNAIKKRLKYVFLKDVFFEQIGFKYMGIVDGHDMSSMIGILNQAKELDGPKVIHVATQKGKGYEFAESNPSVFHGVKPFSIETGNVYSNSSTSYTNVFSKHLCSMMENDKKIVAITAAMMSGTGLSLANNKFPNRIFDVGIAEQHAVTMASGLAIGGYKPYVCIYSTFLQRAYDQILHDNVLMCLPVKWMIDRAGIVGPDGETHHGIFDIAFLLPMPNLCLLEPCGKLEFIQMLEFSSNYNKGPIAIRYPKAEAKDYSDIIQPIVFNKGCIVREGTDITLVALGEMVHEALKASAILESKGISVEIINPRFIKPFDYDLLKESLNKTGHLITIEEGVKTSGMGNMIVSNLLDFKEVKIAILGIDEGIVQHGTREELIFDNNLSYHSIIDAALMLKTKKQRLEEIV